MKPWVRVFLVFALVAVPALGQVIWPPLPTVPSPPPDSSPS